MGFMDDLRKLTRPVSDEEETDDFRDFEETPARPARRAAYDAAEDPQPITPERRRSTSKVVNITATTQMQVVLAKPDRFEAVSDIANQLRDKHAVVLNLEDTDTNLARRMVDFLSGCAFALDGKIKKIAVSTYLITPYNVDIVGDMIDELENSGLYL